MVVKNLIGQIYTRTVQFAGALILATGLLAACEKNEPSQINSPTYSPPTASESQAKTEALGEVLELAKALPAVNAEGEVFINLKTSPMIYSDAGMLVSLDGIVELPAAGTLSQTLWRQTAGPQAQLLNEKTPNAQVIVPYVESSTYLEFSFLAADTQGHVAESTTRIRVLPLQSPPLANATATITQTGISLTLALAKTSTSPVVISYNTVDGTALADRDYQPLRGQVTLDSINPQAVINITALNSESASEDLYFRLYYTSGSESTGGHHVYVVLPKEQTTKPTEPIPTEPEPTVPAEPVDPVDPVPVVYTITYEAGVGGQIQGSTQQTLSADQTGSTVTAIADPGYRFIQWSDGLKMAARTDSAANSNLAITAQFRRNELWLATGHQGNISVNAGPTTATIDWPTEPEKTYNLIVTADPETEIQNYSVYGATLHTDVTPPIKISELSTDQPVYLALEEDGVLKAWSSFVPRVLGASGVVETQAIDSDDTRYVGGNFTVIGPETGGGVTLPTANSKASHPLAGVHINGPVYSAIADGQGGWYLGGAFSKINGQERRKLAHIDAAGKLTEWNPGKLTSWSPGMNGWVNALAIYQGVIYVGGGVFEKQGFLTAFDTEGELLPGDFWVGGEVYALAIHQGVIYAGGAFRLSAFDTQGQRLPWNPGTNDLVRTLAIDQGIVYVGGNFYQAGGELRSRLAAFDTQGQLLPWNPGADGSIATLSISQGVIYAGSFSLAAGEARANLAAFNTQGQLLPWNPGASGSINTLAIDRGVVYVGGSFNQAGGEARNHLAAFDIQGQLLPWNPGASSQVRTLTVDQGVIYAGGQFSQVGVETRARLAAFDAQGKLLPWNPGADGSVKTLAIEQGVIYAGGQFNEAGGEVRNRLAAFDTQGQLLPWNPGGSGEISTLIIDQGTIYSGGSFTSISGEARGNLAAFDTQGQLLPWNPETNGPIYTLAIDQGVIYAGGGFSQAGGATRNGLAAVDSQGQLLPWNPGTSGAISTLIIDQEIIYIGGSFTRAGGEARSNLAAVDAQGQLLPWAPTIDGSVFTLAADQGVVYAGGRFSLAGGEARGNLAAFDVQGQLLPWGPEANDRVSTLIVHQGLIHAGGVFYRVDLEARGRLATFDLQGRLSNK